MNEAALFTKLRLERDGAFFLWVPPAIVGSCDRIARGVLAASKMKAVSSLLKSAQIDYRFGLLHGGEFGRFSGREGAFWMSFAGRRQWLTGFPCHVFTYPCSIGFLSRSEDDLVSFVLKWCRRLSWLIRHNALSTVKVFLAGDCSRC